MEDMTMQRIRIDFTTGDHDYHLHAVRLPDGIVDWKLHDPEDPEAPVPRAAAGLLAGTLQSLSERLLRVCLAELIRGNTGDDFSNLHGSYKDRGAQKNGK